MSRADPQEPNWLGPLRASYAVHNVTATTMRGDLPFWLVRWDGREELEWMELGPPESASETLPFRDSTTGKKPFAIATTPRRSRRRGLVQLRSSSSSSASATCSLHCPTTRPTRRSFLYAGQFLTTPPTWESLCGQWRELSGKEPASADPDFLRFVKMALRLPHT